VDPQGLWSLFRWIYTGDPNAPDNVYNAAMEAAGKSYTANAGRAHQNLQRAGHLGHAASLVLEAAEGENLHGQIMAPAQMVAQQQNPGGPGMQPFRAVPGMPNMNQPQKDIEKQVIIVAGGGLIGAAAGKAGECPDDRAARADMRANDLAELDPHDLSFYNAPHNNSLDSLAPAQGYALVDPCVG